MSSNHSRNGKGPVFSQARSPCTAPSHHEPASAAGTCLSNLASKDSKCAVEVDLAGLEAWLAEEEARLLLLKTEESTLTLNKETEGKIVAKLNHFVVDLEKKSPQQRTSMVSKLVQHGEKLNRRLKARHRLRIKLQERLVNGKLSSEPLKEPFKCPLQILPVLSKTSISTSSTDAALPRVPAATKDGRSRENRHPSKLAASGAPYELNIVVGGDPGDDADDDESSSDSNSEIDDNGEFDDDDRDHDDDGGDDPSDDDDGGGGDGDHNPGPAGPNDRPQNAANYAPAIPVVPIALVAAENTVTMVSRVVRSLAFWRSRIVTTTVQNGGLLRGLPSTSSLISSAAMTENFRKQMDMAALAACCLAATGAFPFYGGASFLASVIIADTNFLVGWIGSCIGQRFADKLINSEWFQNTRNIWGLRHLHPPEMPEAAIELHPVEAEVAAPAEAVQVQPHMHNEPGFMHVGLCSICQEDRPITDGFIHMQHAREYPRFGGVNNVHHVHMACRRCAEAWVVWQSQLEEQRVEQAEFLNEQYAPRLVDHAANLQLPCISCQSDTYRFSLMSPVEEAERECNQCLHTGQCEHIVQGAPCGRTNTVFGYRGGPDDEGGVQLTAECCDIVAHSEVGSRLEVMVGHE